MQRLGSRCNGTFRLIEHFQHTNHLCQLLMPVTWEQLLYIFLFGQIRNLIRKNFQIDLIIEANVFSMGTHAGLQCFVGLCIRNMCHRVKSAAVINTDGKADAWLLFRRFF